MPSLLRYLVDDDRNQVGPITDDHIEPRTNYDDLVQICGSSDVSQAFLIHLVTSSSRQCNEKYIYFTSSE